jgi:uncharacterized membrane protein YecN with MAPEG domain
MNLAYLVIMLMLLEYAFFIYLVGVAREKYKVAAPAVTGNPEFERYFRVQQNTLEQLIAVIPALWIFGLTSSPLWAAAIGLLFVVSRGFYAYGYIRSPGGRHYGYLVGAVATGALLLGALFGVLRNLYLSAMTY